MRTGKQTVFGRLDADRLDVIENMVMTLAFYRSVDNSKTIYALDNSFMDEYEDESGVDTTNSTNEDYDVTDDYYSPTKESVDTSPYAHYKMNDDAANTTVTDDGTGSNNGIASTNTSNLSVSGKINDCFEFNGSSEYIDVDALAADIKTDTTGSICFWVYHNGGNNAGIFDITDYSTEDDRFLASANSSHQIACSLKAGGTMQWSCTTGSNLTQDTWVHVAIVQNGTEVKIYFNGSEETLSFSTSTDKTAWLNDMTNIDTGRIGAFSYLSSTFNYFDGELDDFRYYQNKVLSSSEVSAIYNSGSGTEADQPAGDTQNMTIISNTGQTADAAPDTVRIVIFEEDVDSITINTDLKAYVSRDGGTTWTEGVLSNDGNYATDKSILAAEIDISGQPSGTDMEYKLVTANNKDLKIHGTGMNW